MILQWAFLSIGFVVFGGEMYSKFRATCALLANASVWAEPICFCIKNRARQLTENDSINLFAQPITAHRQFDNKNKQNNTEYRPVINFWSSDYFEAKMDLFSSRTQTKDMIENCLAAWDAMGHHPDTIRTQSRFIKKM